MDNADNKVGQVYISIQKVMGALAKEGIRKSSKNEQQGYKYRGIDDIYNVLSSFLYEHHLIILPRTLSRQRDTHVNNKGNLIVYVSLEIEYTLLSTIDSSSHTIKVFGEAFDTSDKATNKAMSAAYKYALLQLFCIPTEGDNDADASHIEVRAERQNVPHRTQQHVTNHNPVNNGGVATRKPGDAASVKISFKQIDELKKLLLSLERREEDFLEWSKVKRFEDLSSDHATKSIVMLKEKQQKMLDAVEKELAKSRLASDQTLTIVDEIF